MELNSARDEINPVFHESTFCKFPSLAKQCVQVIAPNSYRFDEILIFDDQLQQLGRKLSLRSRHMKQSFASADWKEQKPCLVIKLTSGRLPSLPSVDQASRSSLGSDICGINEAIPAKTNKRFRKARNNDIISGMLAVSYTVTYTDINVCVEE